MDPASAFALACGIAQFVDLSCKLVVMTKEIFEKGSLTRNDDLEDQTVKLGDLRSRIVSTRQGQSSPSLDQGDRR